MERAAHLATLVAAVALLVGVVQFTKTQHLARRNLDVQMRTLRQDREIKAIELFLKFNEQQQELASKSPPRKGEAAFWRYNALLAATEAVFNLTRGREGWDETVSWMLEVQRPFLLQTEFSCRTFADDFLLRMKKAAPGLKCK